VTVDLASLRHEYAVTGLSESDLAPTWQEQFGRWFAAARVLREPNAMVLSTCSGDRPSSRTVLLKAVDDRGFVLYTNLTSRKGRELAANPWASLLFPWHDLERQVLVAGKVEQVTAQESDAYFATRPRGAQLGAWASHQSEPVSRPELEAAYASVSDRFPDAVPRPPHWGGLRVLPETVEFWQGRPSRLHDRLRYRLAGPAWLVERLSP
jgi:pyridoxamine 5'-phosphate oxidase